MRHSLPLPRWWKYLLPVILCHAAVFAAGPGEPDRPGVDPFGRVVVRARVRDRDGRPIQSMRVRFRAKFRGLVRDAEGETGPFSGLLDGEATTDAYGVATWLVEPPAAVTGGRTGLDLPWFRGQFGVRALPDDPARYVHVLATSRDHARAEVPGATPVLRFSVFEEADRTVGGFPVWLGRDGKLDRVVVAVEGFDVHNLVQPADLMAVFSPAGDPLRWAGVDLMVVNFRDAAQAPDLLAPTVARAVRAAAAASGRSVAVAGLSAGALAARWALAEAEEKGAPLPVNTYFSLEGPHRGAWVNPGLQAMMVRYAAPQHRGILGTPAARALLSVRPRKVRWEKVGLGLFGWEVPAAWESDPSEHEAFMRRLRALNGGGYPRRPRLVALSNGTRSQPSGTGDLLHLWLPFGHEWTQSPLPQDHQPGSLISHSYAREAVLRLPFGIGGAYLRSLPTFVPTDSALDASPGERSPFGEVFTRKHRSIPHNMIDDEAAGYVLHALLRSRWDSAAAAGTAAAEEAAIGRAAAGRAAPARPGKARVRTR